MLSIGGLHISTALFSRALYQTEVSKMITI